MQAFQISKKLNGVHQKSLVELSFSEASLPDVRTRFTQPFRHVGVILIRIWLIFLTLLPYFGDSLVGPNLGTFWASANLGYTFKQCRNYAIEPVERPDMYSLPKSSRLLLGCQHHQFIMIYFITFCIKILNKIASYYHNMFCLSRAISEI
jgi:hypothetical protein